QENGEWFSGAASVASGRAVEASRGFLLSGCHRDPAGAAVSREADAATFLRIERRGAGDPSYRRGHTSVTVAATVTRLARTGRDRLERPRPGSGLGCASWSRSSMVGGERSGACVSASRTNATSAAP